MATCILSGTLLDIGSNPITGAYVRARTIAPTVTGHGVSREVPTGTINGANKSFTMAGPLGSNDFVFVDGILDPSASAVGNVLTVSVAPRSSVIVERVNVQGAVSAAAWAGQDLTTKTAADGTWSLTLTQGLAAQIDIPAAGIAADVQIPYGSVAINFSALTLYNRGALTPMTILSDHGPSFGGDLSGSSPNPIVVGFGGLPLVIGTPAQGKGYAWDVGSGAYTLQNLGGEVASVNAGAGITVTGAAADPIVGITNAGVTAAMLGTGAAATNVGSLSGCLTGTLPTPSLAASSVTNANVATGAAISWSKISKVGAVPADIGAASANASVNSITAGVGITLTGLGTDPVISVQTGGVTGAMLAASAAATNVGSLGGVLAGTLPNPTHAAGAIVNADINASAAIVWTKISKAGAVPSDIGAEASTNKGAAGGYAPLDGSMFVPLANLPATMAPGIHATRHATAGADPISPASIGASAVGHTHVESDVTSLATDLADKLSKASGGTVAGAVMLSSTLTVTGLTTLNGGLVSSGTTRISRVADATAPAPAKLSYHQIFEGSVWNSGGGVPERRLISLVNTPTALNTGKLSILGYSTDNAEGAEVASINAVTGAWTGPVVGNVTGNLTGAVTGNADTATDGLSSASGTAPLTLNLAAKALTGLIASATTGALGVVKLAQDLGGTGLLPTVILVGGSTAANVHAAELLANAATDANTVSTIVRRDASGGFSAGTIHGDFVGTFTGLATSVSGLVTVPYGGTGAVTLTGLLRGNGTSAVTGGALVALASEVSGALPIANGGTGQTTAAAGFDALSPMTLLGDIIYGGTSGTRTRLSGNVTTTRKFLRQIGDGAGNSGVPAWDTLVAGDIPNLAGSIINSGLVGVAYGGLGAASLTGLLRGNTASPVTGGAQASLTTEVTGILPVANGGSGASTLTGYLKGNGASAFTAQATPIPVADGGTGTTATFTAGGVVFAAAAGAYSHDPTKLFYDSVAKRLGIGTNVPGSPLTVAGDIELQAGSGGVLRFPDGTTQSTAPTGGGSLLSVGLTMPAELSVASSPLTGAGGTIAVTWASALANRFLAAPNGAPGTPSFRVVVAADLPSFGAAAAGIVPLSGGGTTNFLRADGTWAAPPGTGSVTGTGTAGYLAFWSGASALSADAAAFWDNTNKRFAIGNVVPVAPLHIGTAYASDDPTGQSVLITGAAGSAAMTLTEMTQSTGAKFTLRAAASTPGVAGLASGKVMGLVTFDAFDASTWGTMAKVRAVTTQQHTASHHGTALVASVTADNAATATDALWLAQTGFLGLGTAAVSANPAVLLDLGAGAGAAALRMRGSTSGYIDFKVPAAPGSLTYTWPTGYGTASYFLQTDGAGGLTWAAPGAGGSVSGSGAANQLTSWSGASAVTGNAALLTNASGYLGVGVAPSYPVTAQQTASNGTYPASVATFTDIISGSAAVAPTALSSIVTFTAASWSSGNLTAENSQIDVTGAGAITSLYNHIANASLGASASVVNRYGYHVVEVTGAGNLTGENVGVLVDSLAKGTSQWAIKTLGVTPSYFGGPVRLVAESYSPVSGMEGALWHDSVQNALAMYPGATGYGLKQWPVGIFGAQYQTVSVSNTSSTTSVLTGSHTGTYTTPAGALVVGKHVRVTAYGSVRADSGGAVSVWCGPSGYQLMITGTPTLESSYETPFTYKGMFTIQSSGVAWGWAEMTWSSTHSGGSMSNMSGEAYLAWGTGALTFDLKWKFATANPTNYVSFRDVIFELLD